MKDLVFSWVTEDETWFQADWEEMCGSHTMMQFPNNGEPWLSLVERWIDQNPCVCRKCREAEVAA